MSESGAISKELERCVGIIITYHVDLKEKGFQNAPKMPFACSSFLRCCAPASGS